jgi:hypothetical protein
MDQQNKQMEMEKNVNDNNKNKKRIRNEESIKYFFLEKNVKF